MPNPKWIPTIGRITIPHSLKFDAVHQKGFAFRYSGLGGEFCLFDFPTLLRQMEHIQQVLGGIETYLIETYAQNKEYEAYLESEFGSDMY